MSYEDFYNKVSAIVKENYSEANIANKVIATLEQFRLDQKAAQQGVQLTVLPVREIEIICPNCNLVIDVPVPTPHSG